MELQKHILSLLVSSPETQVNHLKTRSCIPSSLPCTICVPPSLPAHLSVWQRSQFCPNCCNSQSISHTPGLTVRWNVQFLLIKMFSSLRACPGKLGDDIWTQLQAHKPGGSSEEVGTYFSLVIFHPASWFVKTWLMIFECCQGWRYWLWTLGGFNDLPKRKWGLKLTTLMYFTTAGKSSLSCISAEYCPVETAHTSPSSPALGQASPLPGGHMVGRAILHGCKSKTQSCSSWKSMRIFAFSTFMETGSCPKHIPREWIFQKYEFSLPHTKTFIVRPGGTPQQNTGKRKR